ncbi:MAG: hypothetical protein U0840_24815 [Gemmataceae bacterium]
MADNPGFKKVTARTAREVCQLAELDLAELPAVGPEQTPRSYLDVLWRQQKYPDGVKFLAAALPKREAIWWGCLCLHQAGHDREPADAAMMAAIMRWVQEPTEARRKEAEKLTPGENPLGFLLRAVLWTGGSLAPAGAPEVAPGPQLPAKGVSGAVLLAAVLGPPEATLDRFRDYLALGMLVGRELAAIPTARPAGAPLRAGPPPRPGPTPPRR